MANLGDISKINLPNGNVVNIKDATARAQANWNTNNGVKNLLDVTYDTYTNNECSYVKNADGSITLTISSTVAANRQLNLTDKMDNIYDGMIINGSPTGYATGNIEYLITGLKADGTYQNEQFSYNGADSTINRGTPKILFAIYVKSGVTARTVTLYPMVREVGDSTYEPYALPNTKITPELIELVDSGAKNELNGTATSSGICTVNSDGSITVNGTVGNTDIQFVVRQFTAAEGVKLRGKILSGCPSGGGLSTYGLYLQQNQSPWTGYANVTGDYGSTISNSIGITGSYLLLVLRKNQTISNVTFKPMICSKAAWDVSQKYVPYRPTYEETVEQVATNKNNISLYQPTYEKYEYGVTNINTYEYSGVSFTVPANQVVDFTVCYQYNGGDATFNPSICVADSSSNLNTNATIIAENTQENSQTGKSYWCYQLTGITPRRANNTTYYIWVKSGNDTTNHVCLMKRRIE